MTTYHADLNPAFPSRGQKRWAVFFIRDGAAREIARQYVTRKAAENYAAALNDIERIAARLAAARAVTA